MGLDTPFSINATFLLSRGILSFLFSPSQISRSVLSVLVSVGNCLQSQLPAAALYLAQSLSFAQLTIRTVLPVFGSCEAGAFEAAAAAAIC